MQPNDSTSAFFRITVIDESTGRGIPMVRLTSLNQTAYYTDSAGVIALLEPAMEGQAVYFEVFSHGYDPIPDSSGGDDGVTLNIRAGGSAVLMMKRRIPAQRLYRITGSDIYRDSLLLGDSVPVREPLLNAQVTGQDSTLIARYKDRLFWVWGDTKSPRHYSHWNFKVTCATSVPPDLGGLDPELGVDLEYFTKEDGFTRQMAPFPGPRYLYWLSTLVALRDKAGQERLFSSYLKIQPGNLVGDRVVDDAPKKKVRESTAEKERKRNFPAFRAVAHGMAEFSDEKGVFEPLWEKEMDTVTRIFGHPFRAVCDGREYIYITGIWPSLRVPATVEDFTDLESYETFTCLKEGERFNNTAAQLDRRADGSLRYGWKKNTSAISPWEHQQLIEAGFMRPEEVWVRFHDVETGEVVHTQHNTVRWNPWRERFVMITTQVRGASGLGEIYYAEADTPVGPWAYMRKIITHEDYSFYNPLHHDQFDKDGGRVIYLEGTYTRSFSGNTVSTPRYDYNQIMYKLELDDPRLCLPVAVYRLEGDVACYRTNREIPASFDGERAVAFFSPDLERPGTVPVYEVAGEVGTMLTLDAPTSAGRVVFYAEPFAEDANPPSSGDSDVEEALPVTVPLWEYANADGARFYSIASDLPGDGWTRSDRPLCRVWPPTTEFNPYRRD